MTQDDSQPTPSRPLLYRFITSKYLWLMGLALYVGFLFYVGWDDIGSALQHVEYPFLIGLVLVEIVALGVRIVKWHLALRPEAHITRLAFISKAGGNLTPGRLGEFSPLLFKDTRSSKVGAWILLDRLLEATATLLLGLIGFVAVLGIAQGNAILYASLFLLTGIVIVSYGLMQERYLKRLLPLRERVPFFKRPLDLLLSISGELQLLRPKIPVLALLSLVATLLDILVAWCICRSLGFDVGAGVLALTQVTHAVVSVIPFTPNATGLPYMAAATILYQFGGVSEGALAVIVVLRTLLANMTFWSLFFCVVGTKKSEDR